ncbi:cystinosin homolog [Prosopis cineraria]|uniref:cystinosin homolog n=1 Tax=Prosopis cineraria TaxID=364024 RepID=UPI002410106E|nr:cystinosin homolog [Prosopis cineraria]XP_054795590.1 cystinosin homolog [Prosopis cineraria]XP_054795591.1 cystinosin homolog [Prosopis cineraria]XP_054795592.1 cystinosin homolog [Prosopis cineraria]
MASWNLVPLHVSYEVLGWLTFICWSVSFYPQVILNYHRKSVVGLNFDFVVLNLTKHTSYLLYNASLYFSSTIQKQYRDKYGQKEMIPVAANDVAFSSHAVLLTTLTLFQITIYEHGNQKVSKIAYGIVVAAWLIGVICFFITLSTHHWLWLLSIFNGIQVCMTTIKYIPQAMMNFIRKSTIGWSIENIQLDFSGSIGNYAQMVMQSIDQGSWVNLYGNIGKVMLSLVSLFFDIMFMIQHYVLYRHEKGPNSKTPLEVEIAKSIDRPMELLLKDVEIEEIEEWSMVP